MVDLLERMAMAPGCKVNLLSTKDRRETSLKNKSKEELKALVKQKDEEQRHFLHPERDPA